VTGSETLLGVIISGPYGVEFAFERENSAVISWTGNNPRFQRRFGISNDPYFAPLRVEGLRNATITAVSDNIDYPAFTEILKQSLILVLAAMVLSAATLLIYSLAKGKEEPLVRDKMKKTYTSDEENALLTAEEGTAAETQGAAPPEAAAVEPRGLYSDRSKLGWEPYTRDRLSSELRRCSDSGQDLTLLAMEMSITAGFGIEDTSVYRKFADGAVQFFNHRDLIFERAPRGIVIILPNTSLEQGLSKAEQFHGQLVRGLPEIFPNRNDLRIGLSALAGRSLEADRLLLEATKALERTRQEASPIVAFKSDPEKYRAWQNRGKVGPAGIAGP
jgi:hypothetical protein